VSRPPLRTPQDDGQILIQPPPSQLADLIGRNRDLLNSSAAVFSRPLSDFRRQAIGEATACARNYLTSAGEPTTDASIDSLILAGHQPDLFHPGVWVKNFVLFALSRRAGTTPVNLIVDNDAVKHTAIAVPMIAVEPAQIQRLLLPFDSFGSSSPYEERRIHDESAFDRFPIEIGRLTDIWPNQPIVNAFWSRARQVQARTPFLGEVFTAARRSFERDWNCRNLEAPISRISQMAAFAEWSARLVADLPRVHAAYNAAVADYRCRHRIRGRRHPVPDLARDGDWLEAPFWAWSARATRREPLFVRAEGGRLYLRAGRAAWPDLPNDTAGTAWSQLEHEGFKVRPRALTTTLFARLMLGDLFIHGIGGAKYDEVTNQLITRLIGIEPPGFAVVSGTLRLPFPSFSATEVSLRAARRRVRELDWNPQRYLSNSELTNQHRQLATANPSSAKERRGYFLSLRELNSQMRPLVASERQRAAKDAKRAADEMAANAILGDRDYAFVLHSERRLREFLRGASIQLSH
jgi:hypothetical protein